MVRRFTWFAVLAAQFALVSSRAAAQRSWDDGGSTSLWSDQANWNPDGDPGGIAISVGNLVTAANDVTLVDADYVIDSLSVSGGAQVVNSTDAGATTSFSLRVEGPASLLGVGSAVVVYGGFANALDVDALTIAAGGSLKLNSERPVGIAVVEVDAGALMNNFSGAIFGNGRIALQHTPAAGASLLINEGTISAGAFDPADAAPPATTLQIAAASPNARVDLDGSGFIVGKVAVRRNGTLDVDVPLSDIFDSELTLEAGATLDIATPWTFGDGQLIVDTKGATPSVPGPAAHLAGGQLTQTGGAWNLGAVDSLAIDAPLTAAGGAINNRGTILFNSAADIQSGSDFNMIGGASKLVVNSAVTIATPDFDLDGLGEGGNVTMINPGGKLSLLLGADADEEFDHTIDLRGGEFSVSTDDDAWGLAAQGAIHVTGQTASVISGETFQVAGGINIAADARLNVPAATQISGAAHIDVAAGGVLDFNNVVFANEQASLTGAGALLKGNAEIQADTTWDIAVVDLDDGTTTLNADLTINAGAIDVDGDGLDATGAIIINNPNLLTINIAGGGAWSVDMGGSITYNGIAAADSYLAGSDVMLNGVLNHSGDGRVDARLVIGPTGAININTSGEPLRLSGGNATDAPNVIAGGVIDGVGLLGADAESALHGFGTINSSIDFDGSANLYADNGALNLNGAILDVNEIGALDDGVLSVATAWHTNATGSVNMLGGSLVGAAITNNGLGGIQGRGLVSAHVTNNSHISAQHGGTLIVAAPANDNDWDGGGAGALNALGGDLEVRDNADFPFQGTVSATAGRTVFANGFALEFEPGSTLDLTGGAYRTTGGARLGGNVIVGVGVASTLRTNGTTVFESGSTTTLNSDLVLDSPLTVIQSGADFTGNGSLINPEGRTLQIANDVDSDDLAVLVNNNGALQLGEPGQVAQAVAVDLQQGPTSRLQLDLGGAGLNEFDHLSLTGLGMLDGALNLTLVNDYEPTIGQSLTILSSVGGLSGAFDVLRQPVDMPPGLIFKLNYLSMFVRIEVVSSPALSGDFDADGDVDGDDLGVWREAYGTSNTADADGDNDTDGADFLRWQRLLGTVPTATGGVPEPGALILFVVAGAALRALRFARRPPG